MVKKLGWEIAQPQEYIPCSVLGPGFEPCQLVGALWTSPEVPLRCYNSAVVSFSLIWSVSPCSSPTGKENRQAGRQAGRSEQGEGEEKKKCYCTSPRPRVDFPTSEREN